MTVGVVIQARMGSSRLPGKVLMSIGPRVLLDHVLGRLKEIGYPVTVVVATTTEARDDAIVAHCDGNVSVFRGSETDVLRRYVECTKTYGFSNVVRLTADNPFTDIVELERLIRLHIEQGFDYTHSFGMMPLGVGAEIFTEAALRISDRDGHAANHREHVNEFIQENPALFRIGVLDVPANKRAPTLRMTVDTPEDLELARRLVTGSGARWVNTEEAICAC